MHDKFYKISKSTEKIRKSSQRDIRDKIVTSIYKNAEDIYNSTVTVDSTVKIDFDNKLDNFLTSKFTGFLSMGLLLSLIFWITIAGANYPSELLATFLFWIEDQLTVLFTIINVPTWIHGMLVLGVYRCLAWVIAVMLPPMAIFFPLFTFLEDVGYLPRIAFNLDIFFKKAYAHGKQALTMSMGFGCNAAGIIACRIIDSPRERLIAILTNNFVPCNGRFPLIIALASIFMGGMFAAKYNTLIASMVVVAMVMVGIMATLLVSWGLSKTLLKGVPSSFTLELPPYRKPQIGKILIRSLLDRTLFVLGRAIAVAAPAGVFIWALANLYIKDVSLLNHAASFLDPFGKLIGLDGFIIMAFILGLPANEIVLPILIMSYLSQGAMLEFNSLEALKNLLLANNWTWITALNMMLFSVLHFPCGTTLWTIFKETQSSKWTWLSAIIPTGLAVITCFIVYQTLRMLGLS